MNDLAIFIGPLAFVLYFVMVLFASRRACPDCRTRLPLLISPLEKTKRQWLEGGWICPNCGAAIDWKGKKVEMPWSPNRLLLWAQGGLLASALGVGIVLLYFAYCLWSSRPGI